MKRMARRKRQIDRKWHRWFLELGVIDASQSSMWRRRLFDAPLYTPFEIDVRHVEGLPDVVRKGIVRHKLAYVVCKVLQAETSFAGEDWGDCVFFRFQAKRYPEIVSFTVNNPQVI
jgi:hypothetical protein